MDARNRRRAEAVGVRAMTLSERGRKGGKASGAVRRAQGSRRWKTITFAVPPEDYAQLTQIVERDGTRYSTLAREAIQSYLAEVESYLQRPA